MSRISKYLMCSLLAVVTASMLAGCSLDIPGSAAEKSTSSSSDKSADSETSEEEMPTIVVGEDPNKIVINPEPSEDTESEEEPDVIEDAAEDENSFHGYILSEEEQNDPRVKCMETATEGEVTLDFAGDINFDDGYANMGAYHGNGGIHGVLSSGVFDELQGADIFMINNEFPYSTGGTPTPGKRFTFRAKPEYVKNLTEMGVDIVSLANNHAYDHGEQALLDTFDVLDSEGIPYVGAGKNIDEACKPFYFIAGGMKIAYVSATQIERNDPPDTKEATASSAGVLRTLDPTRFLSVIEEAEQNADFTVVYVHWGSENTYDPDDSQKSLARKFADAGADLIIGDHSHCLQGFEYIGEVPVIYSMGNFWFSSKNLDTGIVRATVTKDGIKSVKFLPCVQHDCRTDLYEKGDAEHSRILSAMVTLSFDVSIDEDGYVTPGAGSGMPGGPTKALKKASYQLTPEEQAAQALQDAINNGTIDPSAISVAPSPPEQ